MVWAGLFTRFFVKHMGLAHMLAVAELTRIWVRPLLAVGPSSEQFKAHPGSLSVFGPLRVGLCSI